MASTFETRFTRLAGIEVPIVQAPIGGLARPELAAAVSNAGGLGMLALTWSDAELIAAHLRRVGELTTRPVGVNLILVWDQSERLRQVLDAGIRIVSFFWGDPAEVTRTAHDAGAIVTHTVGSADEARRAVDAGVDVIVAQGWEAGGHVWGGVATLPLVPAVVDAVAPLPVVAAGGIADGRGLAAVLALGAAGAWLGTRFVMSEEARALPAYLARLRDGRETDTVYSQLFDGGWPDSPHRTLRNGLIDAWEASGRPGPGARAGEGDVVGRTAAGDPISRYQSVSPAEGFEGDVDELPMWAGQSVGTLHEVLPAGEIVRAIVAEAEQTLARLSG